MTPADRLSVTPSPVAAGFWEVSCDGWPLLLVGPAHVSVNDLRGSALYPRRVELAGASDPSAAPTVRPGPIAHAAEVHHERGLLARVVLDPHRPVYADVTVFDAGRVVFDHHVRYRQLPLRSSPGPDAPGLGR